MPKTTISKAPNDVREIIESVAQGNTTAFPDLFFMKTDADNMYMDFLIRGIFTLLVIMICAITEYTMIYLLIIFILTVDIWWDISKYLRSSKNSIILTGRYFIYLEVMKFGKIKVHYYEMAYIAVNTLSCFHNGKLERINIGNLCELKRNKLMNELNRRHQLAKKDENKL